jgi:hypothetical protein
MVHIFLALSINILMQMNVVSDTIPPQYPGGEKAWVNYVRQHLDASAPMRAGATPGQYSVKCIFTVSEDGSIEKIEPQNDPGYGVVDQVVNLLKKSGKWTPATLNGKSIAYNCTRRISILVSKSSQETPQVAAIRKMYMDTLSVSPAIADSMIAIQHNLNEAAKRVMQRMAESKSDKLTDVMILLARMRDKTQKLLSDDQFKRWLAIKGPHSNAIDIPMNYFLSPGNDMTQTYKLRKFYVDSLNATPQQVDTLLSIHSRFDALGKIITDNDQETKHQRLEQLIQLLLEKDKRVKEVLDTNQYKIWHSLQVRQFKQTLSRQD